MHLSSALNVIYSHCECVCFLLSGNEVVTVCTPAFAESVTEGDVRWEKGWYLSPPVKCRWCNCCDTVLSTRWCFFFPAFNLHSLDFDAKRWATRSQKMKWCVKLRRTRYEEQNQSNSNRVLFLFFPSIWKSRQTSLFCVCRRRYKSPLQELAWLRNCWCPTVGELKEERPFSNYGKEVRLIKHQLSTFLISQHRPSFFDVSVFPSVKTFIQLLLHA